jgi:hypothetical protein
MCGVFTPPPNSFVPIGFSILYADIKNLFSAGYTHCPNPSYCCPSGEPCVTVDGNISCQIEGPTTTQILPPTSTEATTTHIVVTTFNPTTSQEQTATQSAVVVTETRKSGAERWKGGLKGWHMMFIFALVFMLF